MNDCIEVIVEVQNEFEVIIQEAGAGEEFIPASQLKGASNLSNANYGLLTAGSTSDEFIVPGGSYMKILAMFYAGTFQSGFVQSNAAEGKFLTGFTPVPGMEIIVLYI